MIEKVKISVKTKLMLDKDFVVCARTDSRSVEGFDSVIKRSKQYIDAGADMIFPEGLQTKDEFYRCAELLKSHNPNVILMANMTEFGQSELLQFSDLKTAGYSCVIYPVSTVRIALKAVDEFLKELKEQGIQRTDKMMTRQQLYD